MLKWFRVEQLHSVITYETRGRSSVVEREPFKFEVEGSIPSALTYFILAHHPFPNTHVSHVCFWLAITSFYKSRLRRVRLLNHPPNLPVLL